MTELTLAIRIAAQAVLPVLLLVTLALASGALRMVALAAFLVAALCRVAFLGAEQLGDRIPRPHWNPTTPRPIPAPEVSV